MARKALLCIDVNGEDAQLARSLTERLDVFTRAVKDDLMIVFIRMQDKSGWSHIPNVIENNMLSGVSAAGGLAINGHYGMGKPGADAFDSTHLAHILKHEGVEEILCSGLWLNMCVSETALGALAAGFKVSVIKDMTDTPAIDRDYTSRAQTAGIGVVTSQDVLKSIQAGKQSLHGGVFGPRALGKPVKGINAWAREIALRASRPAGPILVKG